MGVAILCHIADHLEARRRRANICAAAEVFFDQIILDRALQRAHIGALLFGNGDIERQKPRRCRVDRHRRVHLLQRNIFEQCAHIAQVADGHAHFTHFAARKDVIAVIACLGGQIEGNREACLTLRKIGAVERV